MIQTHCWLILKKRWLSDMVSENKKKKLRDSYQVPGGLKTKYGRGIKGLSFFTSSARQALKNETKKSTDEK